MLRHLPIFILGIALGSGALYFLSKPKQNALPPAFTILRDNNKNFEQPPCAIGEQKFWWILKTAKRESVEDCRAAARAMVQYTEEQRAKRGDKCILMQIAVSVLMDETAVPPYYYDYSLKNLKEKRVPVSEFAVVEDTFSGQ